MGDLEKMGTGLQKLAAEDPSFHYSRDEETNQTVIEGMGELHLEILVDRLKREFNVECDVGAPQVNYRESISKPSTVKYTHKKQSGGSGQFADVEIKFEPGEPGTGFEFVSEIKGGAVPKEYIPGVSKGLQDMMGASIMAGFPVGDVKATLFEGIYGRRHRGPQLAAWDGRRAQRQARRHARGERHSAPVGDVQLRLQTQEHDQGPRKLHHGAGQVRCRAPEHRQGYLRREKGLCLSAENLFCASNYHKVIICICICVFFFKKKK